MAASRTRELLSRLPEDADPADPLAALEDPTEMVDPYANALGIAYLLAPAHTLAEEQLENILAEYCSDESIDIEGLLEKARGFLGANGIEVHVVHERTPAMGKAAS